MDLTISKVESLIIGRLMKETAMAAIIVQSLNPKCDSLKMEVTQNEIAPLSEQQFDDIYLHSLRLLRTVFCRKNMRALYDIALNERFKMAPNIGLTVNHIISTVNYCDFHAMAIGCCWFEISLPNRRW